MATTGVMTAAIQYSYGGPECIQVKDDVPIPQYTATQVLVKVHASTVTGLDPMFRKGKMKYIPFIGTSLPYIPGLEFSGVVHAVGDSVTRFKVGDEVISLFSKGGCAQYSACEEKGLALKPPNVTHLQAAALPGCAVTAYKTLIQYGQVKPGGRMLVIGAAGASGSVITQWAKAMGFFVIGVCSTNNVEWVTGEVGADLAIDYRTQKYTDVLPNEEDKVDYVIDTINVWDPSKTTGESAMEQAYKVLKPGGDYITITSPNVFRAWAARFGLCRPFTRVGFGNVAGTVLEDVVKEYYTSGKVKPLNVEVMPLSQIQEIHRKIDAHQFRCKIVVEIPQ